MSHRMFIALALSTALVGNACAAENSETQANEATAVAGATVTGFSAPEEAWRTVDPENLLVIDTKYGDIGVELFPEISPNHVAQIKTLTKQGFYNDVVFHRVIDGFMNQTGDGTNGDGTGDSTLPDIAAEFTFRRGTDMPFTLVTAKKVGDGEIGVGFYKNLQIASQPTSQAMFTKDNKVDAFGLHCKGVTSMARTNDPNSANSQFFLMRGQAEHLDTQYSIWGSTVMGYEHLEKPLVGTIGQVPGWMPDRMNKVELAVDMAEDERPTVQVLRTDHPAFANWLKTQKNADGTFPNVCDLSVPTRVL
ncbi:MAG: peptidylprolyl isomerase [Litorimonas sp.]